MTRLTIIITSILAIILTASALLGLALFGGLAIPGL
jgi:hypothetical protein